MRRKKNGAPCGVEAGEELREALALVRERVSAGGADTLWVEETLKAAALASAAQLLGLFYSKELPALLGLDAPSGGRGVRNRTVLTTVGEVTYTRAYTAASGGGHRFPLDEALGITEGCTPAMASMMSWAGARFDSYDIAGEALGRLAGLEVPGRRVQRMVNTVAEREAAWIAKRATDKAAGGILNLQADMTGIPMRPEELVSVKGHDGGDPKKRQIKAGAVFRQEENADGEIQRIPDSTTRVVTFDDVTSFSQMLMDEAVRRGYNSADKVVFTSDGAEWIWLMVADRFKGAVEIVDFYHAAEHLGALCSLAEPDKRKAADLFKKRRRIMLNWGAESAIRYFMAIPEDHANKKAIEDGLGYFINNRKRMRYREFREKGYFIGSGVIEGTCKCLVNQRTDLGGQRWLRSGSLNVLRIRAAIIDNLHDRYWKTAGKITRSAA